MSTPELKQCPWCNADLHFRRNNPDSLEFFFVCGHLATVTLGFPKQSPDISEAGAAVLREACRKITPNLKYCIRWDEDDDRWDDPGHAANEALDVIISALATTAGESFLARLMAAEKERDALKCENEKLREDVNWQNRRNSGHPTRGGYEFYINEEWTGLANAAIDAETTWCAALRKNRIDPDDERVRIRRVAEDDEILKDLATAEAERDTALAKVKKLEAQSAWRPIESAPKDGTAVLICNAADYLSSTEAAAFHNGAWWYGISQKYDETPTHWQPLPPPPAAADSQNQPTTNTQNT